LIMEMYLFKVKTRRKLDCSMKTTWCHTVSRRSLTAVSTRQRNGFTSYTTDGARRRSATVQQVTVFYSMKFILP